MKRTESEANLFINTAQNDSQNEERKKGGGEKENKRHTQALKETQFAYTRPVLN